MSAQQWDDLTPRIISAVALLGVGAAAVWLGGVWFRALVGLGIAAMLWELWQMMRAARAQSVSIIPYLSYALAILIAGAVFVAFRDQTDGFIVIVWLFAIVILTDVLGYFAGRIVGGAKFWPSISPKKTWSGTIVGWVGAGFAGYAASHLSGIGFPPAVLLISVALSFASQLGDICESALKRRAGVKDSSNLIPGHGGVLDRCDGMVGVGVASFLIILIYAVFAG